MQIKRLTFLSLIIYNISFFTIQTSLLKIYEKHSSTLIYSLVPNNFGEVGDEQKKELENYIKKQHNNINYIKFSCHQENKKWVLELEEIKYNDPQKEKNTKNYSIKIDNQNEPVQCKAFKFYKQHFFVVSNLQENLKITIESYKHKDTVCPIKIHSSHGVIPILNQITVFTANNGKKKPKVEESSSEKSGANKAIIVFCCCAVVGYFLYNYLKKAKQQKKVSWQFWKN